MDCEQFEGCDAEECGTGTKQGTKECWVIDGRTGQEKPNSRHQLPCSEPCSKSCIEKCDEDCVNYGPCIADPGPYGLRRGTKECWAIDAETGKEIPTTRYTVDCDETCFIGHWDPTTMVHVVSPVGRTAS